VYLGIIHSTNEYVAIKIKEKSRAVNEARILVLLNEQANIPVFHGLLVMSESHLLGVVCELIADGRNSRFLLHKLQYYVQFCAVE